MENERVHDISVGLAESVDTDALYYEVDSGGNSSLIREIQKSFRIQFQENQQNIQNKLVRMAATETKNKLTNLEESNRDQQLQNIADNLAEQCFIIYANTLWDEDGFGEFESGRMRRIAERNPDLFEWRISAPTLE